MKILHIALSLSPRCGGPSVAVAEMTRHQVLTGLDVTVYSTNMDYPSGILDVPINRPVMIHGVRHYYFSVQFTPLLVSLPMAIELRKTIRNYDLLHIHALYRFPTTFAAFLCRKYNIPYIVEPHGSLDPYLYKQSAHNVWAKRAYEKMFDLPNLNAASAIHFSSAEEMARTDFLNLRAPGVVVPNGLHWNRFKSLPSRGGLRKRLGLADEPMILFLGRINFKKGLDLLVQAFSEVAAVLDDAVLVIAGPDNNGYAKVVHGWIAARGLSDKVYWQEMLYDDEVLEAYVDADVFVLPSYTENFGIAVVEAMACALPVVISDQVNISNEVSQSAAGIVVGLTSQEIARATISIMEDKKLACRMGKAGRELAKNRYAYDHIIEQLTGVYKTIINTLPIKRG
ncbi:MAG: glycosyltransferase [Desulfobacteraceae bacterium]|jgi:glycosyltransferase involved in cell wall biosynthesis